MNLAIHSHTIVQVVATAMLLFLVPLSFDDKVLQVFTFIIAGQFYYLDQLHI